MRRRVELLLSAAGWGANHFSALLIVYRTELGFSAAQLGALFGVYALGLVPGLIFSGRASDRRGRRALVLPASVGCFIASGVLACGSRGFAVLLLGRFLFGLAMGSVMSPGSVWLQELSADDRGPRRATLALSAGFGLGPLISGISAEFLALPMVLPYLVHMAVMCMALFLVRVVPETAAAVRESRSSQVPNPPGAQLSRNALGLLVRQVAVAPWAFGLAAITLVIVPGLLRPYVDRPVLFSAFLIATTLLAGVSIQPVTARLGPRADLWGLALGALGALLATFTLSVHSAVLAFLVATLVGVGYGLVMTNGLREIAGRVAPQERGLAVGIYYVLTYVGFALPFVRALLAQEVSDLWTMGLITLLILGSLLVRALSAPD
jgi:MFS family permease